MKILRSNIINKHQKICVLRKLFCYFFFCVKKYTTLRCDLFFFFFVMCFVTFILIVIVERNENSTTKIEWYSFGCIIAVIRPWRRDNDYGDNINKKRNIHISRTRKNVNLFTLFYFSVFEIEYLLLLSLNSNIFSIADRITITQFQFQFQFLYCIKATNKIVARCIQYTKTTHTTVTISLWLFEKKKQTLRFRFHFEYCLDYGCDQSI